MQFYPAIKKNEVLKHASTQMNLEKVMLSESGQTHPQRHILYNSIYMKYPESTNPGIEKTD